MSINPDAFVAESRQLELFDLAETKPVTAVNTAIIEALQGDPSLDAETRKAAIYDRDLVISRGRQRELIELACSGCVASAVRLAITEAVKGARTGKPVEPALSARARAYLKPEVKTLVLLQDAAA